MFPYVVWYNCLKRLKSKEKDITKTQIKTIIKKIEKHQQAVAKQRDSLDDFIGELEGLKYNCETAWDDLQRARDALSDLV